MEWVAISFSRGSSWTKNRTQVSCNAGRFFTSWATRKQGAHKWEETALVPMEKMSKWSGQKIQSARTLPQGKASSRARPCSLPFWENYERWGSCRRNEGMCEASRDGFMRFKEWSRLHERSTRQSSKCWQRSCNKPHRRLSRDDDWRRPHWTAGCQWDGTALG